jgi:prepilin-type N-terminal cleavage/methylation domain-containing protein
MYRHTKRGFTLIELLVVIAIIAILAAILFPVFAQAREKARQTSCVSNNKQMATATLMYSQDYDEVFPFSYGTYQGVWLTQASGTPYVGDTPPGWRTANADWVGGMGQYWGNSVQPYTKSYGTLQCPSAAIASGLTGTQAAGQPAPVKTSLAYNGLLHSYNLAGINSPATVPMISEGNGRGYFNGYQSGNPFLRCGPNNLPCTYIPAVSGCAASVNGQRSGWFGFIGPASVHGEGQSYAYTDGHVKFRKLSVKVVAPGVTHWDAEPFAQYNATQYPVSSYTDGCHIWFFRPDYVLPN